MRGRGHGDADRTLRDRLDPRPGRHGRRLAPGPEVTARAISRVLVVGTGAFGQRRAAALARRGVSVAFVSRDLERARAATAEVGGPVAEASTDLAGALAW